uniref:NADH dehydrogenase subunit 6 n=1 Tax=Rectidens sumatrensis TaxID=1903498 RepID=A0A8A3WMG3_9BIVA|nr:NADH dehydrogenase subunit 6 [Rectidens sumatrensis]QTA71717.1 NADH dehydrogenase subunit 6 [Rectidens sumatrensis]
MMLLLLSTLSFYAMLSMTLPMHPLSLGMMILLLAFINCTTIASISPWYAYLLFFIFIGGMLVMFAYIASLSPNMVFSINSQLMPTIVTIFSLIFLTNPGLTFNMPTNQELKLSLASMNQYVSSLYLQNGNMCLTVLACLLLFTMIIVVKLCKPKMGALRPYF